MTKVLSPNFVVLLAALLLPLTDVIQPVSAAPLEDKVNASVSNQTNSFAAGISRENGVKMQLLERDWDDDASNVHPWIRLQQQINHAKRRMARIHDTEEPTDEELTEAMEQRRSWMANVLQERSEHMKLVFHQPRVKREVVAEDLGNTPLPRGKRFGKPKASDEESSIKLDARGNGYSKVEAKAANEYSVTSASDVSSKNTAGLSIEANDVGYFVDVKIDGSSFKMLIDSGSSDTWVTGSSCNNCGGSNRKKLDKSSVNSKNSNYKISYGTGNVKINKVSSKFEVAGLSLDDYTFGLASKMTEQFGGQNVPFDGLLGLGGKGISVTKSPTFLGALKQNNKIQHQIVGYRLGRAADGKSNNRGQITFGAVDDSQIDGSLSQLDNQSEDGYWMVNLDKVEVSGKSVGGGGKAVLDTGTSLIIAPKHTADAIHDAIPGAKSDGQGGYTLPCTTNKRLTFTFSGHSFKMDSRDLLFSPKDSNDLTGTCVSAVSTGSPMGNADWLLGAAFLKNVYFATNADSNKVGLGHLK